MKFLKFAICFACLAVLPFPVSGLAAPPSSTVPLDSWIYPALDKLAGLGLVGDALQASRPYGRAETARQVVVARERLTAEAPSVAAELLRRLEREFGEEIAGSSSAFTPLRRACLAWVYRDGEDALFANVPIRQFPLNANDFGIDYGENHNAQAILESEARLGRYFLLQARPLFLQREGEGESVRLLEGKAAVGLGPLELSAGRQSLWWGPGRHSSLLLSNNARPLDMVRLTNPSPATLPWIFRHLGPFRFDLFVSRLEDERVVSEPYFGGLRVNFQPAPWLELGAARTVIFGGDGRPDVGFDDFLTIVGGENLSGEEDNSNSVASLDARVRIPPLAGAEIYAEVGGEDEADALGFIPFISQIGVVGGLYLPRIEPSGRLDLRLEYADTTRQRNSSPVWYRHGIYQSGYTYEGKILGHRAGGDARAYSAELRAFLPRDVTLTLALDLQKRGESQPVREEHLIPSVVAQWQACPGVLLHARYARDEVDNFNFVEGDDRTLHFAVAGVDFAF